MHGVELSVQAGEPLDDRGTGPDLVEPGQQGRQRGLQRLGGQDWTLGRSFEPVQPFTHGADQGVTDPGDLGARRQPFEALAHGGHVRPQRLDRAGARSQVGQTRAHLPQWRKPIVQTQHLALQRGEAVGEGRQRRDGHGQAVQGIPLGDGVRTQRTDAYAQRLGARPAAGHDLSGRGGLLVDATTEGVEPLAEAGDELA